MASDFTRNEKRTMQSLLLALEPLLNLAGPIPLRLATTFLTIASNEGQGVCEYARCLGVHRAVMSKHVHVLADRLRSGDPGLGLIRIEEGLSRPNRQAIFLTPKGRSVAAAMLRPLHSSQTQVA